MRYFYAGISLLITVAFVWMLNHSAGTTPPLGRLLDPVNGCWANAEHVNKNYSRLSRIKGFKAPVTIWLEDRMVPHIHAANDHDLYMAQGYVHACFRLWQMDMQTRAAAGRVSEMVGEKTLQFDRTQRRKGMVYGAGNSLKAMEADPRTKEMLDAYTEGINSFIHSLNYRRLPLEYKLLDFVPEDWTNLKSALLLKYMADDLTGYTEDFPLTYLRDRLPAGDFDMLFPEKIKGYKPVIPEGTKFETASMSVPPAPGNPDSLFVHLPDRKDDQLSVINGQSSTITDQHPSDGIGSNNWAISGKHTASGAPILCNDPHLGLNLPSLWFEIQLQAPGINSYGASLPGAPGIIIGFTDRISWGFTNNYRDVKDFYEITSVNGGDDAYWFNGKQQAFRKEYDTIRIKNKAAYIDTVLYTVHGPVMYDERFEDPAHTKHKYALTWMAHRATNELLAVYKLNRAQNYVDFVTAIMHFECPAQNMVYADRDGNIAIWGQGQFINKWKGQGKYIMEGKDSLTLWGKNIPMNENPHVFNPAQGYVASANQAVTDETYPYWYNGHFLEFRAWEINRVLNQPMLATVPLGDETLCNACYQPQMTDMQNDVESYLLDTIYSTLTNNVTAAGRAKINMYVGRDTSFAIPSARYSIGSYGKVLTPESKLATVYQIWWSLLCDDIWKDDFNNVPEGLLPVPEITMQMLLTDSTSKYYDDRHTPQVETMRDMIRKSFEQTCDSLDKLKATVGLEWYMVKNTGVRHLARLPAFSYEYLKIGGWGNTINAAKGNHGPSWRMIVEMGKDSVRALGVYPGGQSGNPGSKHYADFLDKWVDGKYNRLLFLQNADRQDNKAIKYVWTMKGM